MLVRTAVARASGEPRRGRRILAGFAVASVALAGVLALLLGGPRIGAAGAAGPCPARTSVSAYDGGRELLVRAEPAYAMTVLVHLCADPAIGPVRSWSVRTGDGAAAVQPVAASTALAAVHRPPGDPAAAIVVTVTVVPSTGRSLTFAARAG